MDAEARQGRVMVNDTWRTCLRQLNDFRQRVGLEGNARPLGRAVPQREVGGPLGA